MLIYNYVKGIISLIIFGLNTLICTMLLYPFLFLKTISPAGRLKNLFNRWMVQIGETWISANNINLDLTQNIQWNIKGLDGLSIDRSYLILANHQSWMDIVILQYVLNHRVPFIRFFLKKELIYVPLLGGAWWALDFPFMKRYSLKELRKNPLRRREDFETARQAGLKFRESPVSILSFLEGTRFTKTKHEVQKSPFKNLLVPKVGGLSAVIQGMGENFYRVLDISIVYPEGVVSLLQAFMGQLHRIQVNVRQLPVPVHLMSGDYFNDPSYRQSVQSWVREVWTQKDQIISEIKK